MIARCRTCVNFNRKLGGERRGGCAALPKAIEMSHFDAIIVIEEFGCVVHSEKPDLGEITNVHITRVRKDGSKVIDEYGKLPPGIWDEIHKFMAEERVGAKPVCGKPLSDLGANPACKKDRGHRDGCLESL